MLGRLCAETAYLSALNDVKAAVFFFSLDEEIGIFSKIDVR